MANIVAIVNTVISGAELATKVGEVASKFIPEPPKSLEEKFRWIQCTVKNETQFQILLHDSHFDSGRYWTAPQSIDPFGQMVFSCCNGDHSVMTGATGGTAFRLSLDHKHYFDFAIGWTSPAIGPFQAGVVESSNAKEGYERASPHGGSISSHAVFHGEDKKGHPAKFKIHISAAPAKEAFLYIVRQVPVAAKA